MQHQHQKVLPASGPDLLDAAGRGQHPSSVSRELYLPETERCLSKGTTWRSVSISKEASVENARR